MTALSLGQIVTQALADVGVTPPAAQPKGDKLRETQWIGATGFGIRHYLSGRQVYILQARMRGRVRTVTLGSTAVLSLHQAESVAQRILAHAIVGNDPATARLRARSAPRMDDFITEYWDKCAVTWKTSTQVTQLLYRKHYLDGAFPDTFVDSLDEAEVSKWFARLTDRAGPGGANRVLCILRAALNKAESWGYRTPNSNPCRAVRENRKIRHQRFLSHEELARLGAVLRAARAEAGEDRQLNAVAITLLLLTGCRVGEILGLKWGDVHGNRIKLRDSKMGPRTVWLGDDARDLIATLPRNKNIAWLFWSRRNRKPIITLQYFWHEFRRQAQVPNFRLHDLRHTFASHAAMNAETLPMIGRLLGHAKVESTARYAHLDDGHVQAACEQIGEAIERAIGEGASVC